MFTLTDLLNVGTWNGVAFLTLLYLVSTVVYGTYQAYFHPLSKYPGPKLWAAYRFPVVYNSITGQVPFKVTEAHKKYGPVVRISPDELSFASPEAWNEIYGIQSGRIQNQKDFREHGLRIPGDENRMIHSGDIQHARLRRIYGPGFTSKALVEQSVLLMKNADLLVTQLKNSLKKSSVQDLTTWYNFMTFDFIGDLMFGESFHCLETGIYHFYVKIMLESAFLGFTLQQLNWYGLTSCLMAIFPQYFMKTRDDVYDYMKLCIKKRLERGSQDGPMDLTHHFLTSKNKDDQLSQRELLENSLLFVGAGSETTATMLTAVTFFLCKNPDMLQRAQQEVRTMFQTESEITVSSVNGMKYVIAALSEAMRLVPAVPVGLPRMISTKGGQMVSGHWLPENTRCSISNLAIGRYEPNFVKSDEFHPERWLPDAPAEFTNDKLEASQPFLFGPRGCIGKPLALAEMRLVLAKMLWHFDFELADSEKDWAGDMKAFFVWDKQPLLVRLTERQI